MSSSHDWVEPERHDLTGQTLGDFEVERLLGYGGMGEVYKARQISLDRTVALKVLRPELVKNPTVAARFAKEASSAAKLNEPSIVHIYSFGEAAGLKYLAMEYVEGGKTLKDFLAKKGVPDLPLALSFLRQAAQALKAAGEIGLVHRDIKPENLLLTRKGQLKVADFGLCRQADKENVQLTAVGTTLGTPMYMSPEQVQGKDLDHRSDLYSLGVTFYHVLAGFPPFRSETQLALALKHVNEQPVHLHVHRPDLPADLANLVMRLMAKDPRERPQSAAEVLRDLARIKGNLPTAAATLVDTGAAASKSDPALPAKDDSGSELDEEAPAGLRPRGPLLWAALVLAIVAGGFAGFRDRAEDLLSKSSGETAQAVGLWIADWQGVPAQKSAEAQYRYALLEAADADREAAWLAVPGRFPKAESWGSRAYTQLIRTLFRHDDWERLGGLAEELDASKKAHDRELARIARSVSGALKDDAETFLGELGQHSRVSLMEPAQAEIALEAVERLLRRVPNSERAANLKKLRDELRDALELTPLFRNTQAFSDLNTFAPAAVPPRILDREP